MVRDSAAAWSRCSEGTIPCRNPERRRLFRCSGDAASTSIERLRAECTRPECSSETESSGAFARRAREHQPKTDRSRRHLLSSARRRSSCRWRGAGA